MFATSAPPVPALPPGTLLGEGRYRLEDELGRGGFGITYRARRFDTDELVAVKECVLPGCVREHDRVEAPDDAGEKALHFWSERVLEQAQQLKQVKHPHLARTFEAWRENNTVYLALELLDGPTLRQHVEERGPLSPDEALKCGEELAGALGALHESGLLHLDVKPENAVLTERGAVLMDFDLVQPQNVADFSTRPLSLGARVGTPGYAPPEAYGERAPHGIASDIYSLGATLYFLLSGQTPHSAVDRVAGVDLGPLEIAPHLQESLQRALQLPIAARFDSVATFRESWTPPPAPPEPEDDYSFSAHQANFARSQLASGVYRVVLTTDEAQFPPRCACCFERADKDTHLPVNSPSGKRYIPACRACLRHHEVARASATGTIWGAGMAVPIVSLGALLCVTSNSFLQLVAGLGLIFLALFIYFTSLNYGALKSSLAEEMLKSSCCHSLEPVTYNFNGQVYIWRFKNVMYAEEFKKKNAGFVV